jgi:hypothetical protein
MKSYALGLLLLGSFNVLGKECAIKTSNQSTYTINYPVTIDVKLLLKGSDTLSVDQNIDIFIKVQNFK